MPLNENPAGGRSGEPAADRSGGRRRRLADEEIRRTMLDAGARYIKEEGGLTVSLDHLNYEAIMASSDLSRSSVYRVWRYKEDYFVDLLTELAGPDWVPSELTYPTDRWEPFDALTGHLATPCDPGRRRELFLGTVLRILDRTLDDLIEGEDWHTYLSVAAVMGSGSEASREELRSARSSDRERGRDWLHQMLPPVLDLVGFRPRAGHTLRGFLHATAVLCEGWLLRSTTSPVFLREPVEVDLGSGPQPASLLWGMFIPIFDAYLEADPAWDPDVARARYLEVRNGAARH